MKQAFQHFLKLESASGILLVIATLLAMIAANSPAQLLYDALLSTPVEVRIGALEIAKPLLLWVNDGLMALFFLLVGLEIKREILHGELADPAKAALPVMAAIGGMIAPALLYAAFNWEDPANLRGWAIPAATDIAFALGVLSLLGKRAPPALKLFLLTLAIVDDLGAIVVIALFYTVELSVLSLLVAMAALLTLYAFNRRGVLSLSPYLLVGLVMWVAVLKSGVHATLAGVLLAFFIPLRAAPGEPHTVAEGLEHDLHGSVSFVILPLFAFMNTGVSLAGLSLDALLHPVPLGIMTGLFIGKQLGVMLFCWLAVQLRLAKMPQGVDWWELYGVAVLAGIGFTMSLFISSLAFEQSDLGYAVNDRIGILLGSTASALTGYLLLRWRLRKHG
ncbi:Na+/H+ antiporter NhaA [Candidatus Thiothrix sp. Deng01]|uniref:Na(+)/H(+) antiporter NhaA n=1 Tax=Candidatus Thiothrix phosphatis TaxID=3112415 RepID=A0ABU6CVQ8_9GAMM|nr:Na+/H+ antiporter NhaA [Candidatus Thiothrix sp. Deng01]MEB4590167.1 Na+/H+ antiporter NhaA [Candidatus Thiothrix sp. Deng01]